MEGGSAATRGKRKHPPPPEGDFQAGGNGDASSLCERENGFANSQSAQRLGVFAGDVRAGRWRRKALPVRNARKSSSTSRLSDMTNAPLVYPAAKIHRPLKYTEEEIRAGRDRESIAIKNLDISTETETIQLKRAAF